MDELTYSNKNSINSVTSSKDTTQNLNFCPKCGQILQNSSVCLNCNELGVASTDMSNDYKQFMNDYATELVLWSFTKARRLPENNTDMPAYYTYECNIFNIKTFISQLISKEFLKKADSKSIFNVLKIQDLKSLLKKNNISTTGNKQDLIDKLVSNNVPLPSDIIPDDYYIISSKGKKFYEENYEYVELHKNPDYQITPKDFFEIRKTLSRDKGYSFSDCLWRIFNKRIIEYSSTKQYWWVYYNYLNMAQLTYQENKQSISIALYIKCLIFLLCGVSMYEHYTWYLDDGNKDWLLNSNSDYFYIDKELLLKIAEMKDYYDDSIVDKEYNNLEMNFKLCSSETIKKIIEKLIEDPLFNIEDYKKLLENERQQNLRKYIK